MDNHTRFEVLAKKKVRTTHQEDSRPFAFHLQDMWPRRLKFLTFGEGDGVVLMGGQRTLKSACLLSQRLQFLGPVLGPRSVTSNSIVRMHGRHSTEGDCGNERDSSSHREFSQG